MLSRVLRRLDLPPADPTTIFIGLDSPDDAAVLRPPPDGQLIVQTIDFFRSNVSDPYIFGRISANHALSDCHAMGAQPTSALALAVVQYATEKKVNQPRDLTLISKEGYSNTE